MTPVREISEPTSQAFENGIRQFYQPIVVRGAADHWPLVKAARQSPGEALQIVRRFDSGAPTDIMVAPASEKGRFFYQPDMRGLNFRQEKASLTQLANELEKAAQMAEPPGMYAGATAMASHLPGLHEQQPFALADALPDATPRIWLGNASQVATHFDMSDNFAVVAAGKRRFTLFPPEATRDLYVGPLNFTLAGQPVSMVDPLNPDLARYPNFPAAMELAQYADLEPGDAIYIPTLWWHHVAASSPINILFNYWHNDAAHGGGFLALVHGMLSIRDLPKPEREAWRAWFDHFVFGDEAAQSADHLPPNGQGINGPASDQRSVMMRQFIAQVLTAQQ